MRLVRSGLIYTAANLAVAGLPFLLLPVLTRALTPAEYGHVIAFALIVTLSGALAGLNVHAAVGTMWFRREPEDMRELCAAALALATLSTVIVAPLAALGLHLFPSVGSGLHPMWGGAAAVTAGANVIVQSRLGLWQAQQKPLRLAALQISSAVGNLGLSLVGVLVLGFGAAGRNGAFALSTTLAATASILLLVAGGEIKSRVRRDHVIDLVRFGGPLTLHILGGVVLSTADRWVVSIRLDATALGVYGAGAQLGMAMAILGDAFVKAYAPWFYSRLRAGTEMDRLWAVGAAYGVVPLFFMVALVVGVVLTAAAGLVLGPGFAGSVPLLPWFMIGGALNGVYLSISSLYFYWGRTWMLSAVTLASGAVGLVAVIVLASNFGMVGAAMGYAVSQGVLGLVAMIVAIRVFDLPWGRPGAALRLIGGRVAAPLLARLTR